MCINLTPTCINFPSAETAFPPANTPSRVIGLPVGSCLRRVTLMTALIADRSDSPAAASSKPVRPNTTWRAAISSHGQSPANRRWRTVIAPAAAAGSSRTLRTTNLSNLRRGIKWENVPTNLFVQSKKRLEPLVHWRCTWKVCSFYTMSWLFSPSNSLKTVVLIIRGNRYLGKW